MKDENWIQAARKGIYASGTVKLNSWVYDNPAYSETLLRTLQELARLNTPISDTFNRLCNLLKFKSSHVWVAINFLREAGLIEIHTNDGVDVPNPLINWLWGDECHQHWGEVENDAITLNILNEYAESKRTATNHTHSE